MADITPALVGKLREMTSAGLMDCKNALVEAGGNLDGAVDILRKKGQASAAKKAGREAKEGLIAQAVVNGGKVGVLVEVGCGKAESTASADFKQLVKDITLQIAAASPVAISRTEVPQAVIDKEREIAGQSEAVKNKPPQAVAKIIEGKINKFLETACLLEQGFVKNPDIKVDAHVGSVAKALGDTLTVRRFLRYQVGEAV